MYVLIYLLLSRFYYDFYIPDGQLSQDDFKKIKKEMDKIIAKDLPFRREEVSREEARLVIFSMLSLGIP